MMSGGHAQYPGAVPGIHINIPAWSPLVADYDTYSFRPETCAYCRRPLDQEHVEAFGAPCAIYRDRHRRRYRWIARCHLFATHELALPEQVDRFGHFRDCLIDDLAQYEVLDRVLYQAVAAEIRPDVDRVMRLEHGYRHLDQTWDGKGFRPSQRATLLHVAAAALADDPPAQASSSTHVHAWWVVLGVAPDASSGAIRAAYRNLARRAHPDAGGSRTRWERLNNAYQLARTAGRA